MLGYLWLQKMVGQTKNFPPPLLVLLLDPGSEIWDPGWIQIRIRDQHPGSATLLRLFLFNETVSGKEKLSLEYVFRFLKIFAVVIWIPRGGEISQCCPF
jgi:hypothetical protein